MWRDSSSVVSLLEHDDDEITVFQIRIEETHDGVSVFWRHGAHSLTTGSAAAVS